MPEKHEVATETFAIISVKLYCYKNSQEKKIQHAQRICFRYLFTFLLLITLYRGQLNKLSFSTCTAGFSATRSLARVRITREVFDLIESQKRTECRKQALESAEHQLFRFRSPCFLFYSCTNACSLD